MVTCWQQRTVSTAVVTSVWVEKCVWALQTVQHMSPRALQKTRLRGKKRSVTSAVGKSESENFLKVDKKGCRGLKMPSKMFQDTWQEVIWTEISSPAKFPSQYVLRQNIIWQMSPMFPRQREVKCLVERCKLIRELLRDRLRLLGTPGGWNHLTKQNGLFCCSGLNGEWQPRCTELLPGNFSYWPEALNGPVQNRKWKISASRASLCSSVQSFETDKWPLTILCMNQRFDVLALLCIWFTVTDLYAVLSHFLYLTYSTISLA